MTGSDDSGPDKPFGETEYKNYDPEQIDDIEDAVNLFAWLSEENRSEGNTVAAGVFEDCSEFLRNQFVDSE